MFKHERKKKLKLCRMLNITTTKKTTFMSFTIMYIYLNVVIQFYDYDYYIYFFEKHFFSTIFYFSYSLVFDARSHPDVNFTIKLV